ncbi:uncharacterized protein MELLADRAFT_85954 [Melampsora larici-populina 98AG31]|uniref:DNA (cytosine-5-)-methyltransferase n=1 Tax=Melampsora larici-populina (strain 98AG31 / pathotype 3-4-7) TaxID=747676 RepID=F4RK98_MELLP|nr:uncharacterized protein MELLADRAFT_85954 [Melampsora larici-populina 98AG31]EGG07057.1 hypothetical protein MELLADRAFT_85954 [Melampsora larici-populina 98AG31]
MGFVFKKDTFVGQAADDFELVLIDQCFEFELSPAHKVLNVHFMFSDQSFTNPLPSQEYYCRYRWLPMNGAFIQLERPSSPLLHLTTNPLQIPHSPSEVCRRCSTIPKEVDWIRDPSTNQILLGPDDRHLSLGFIINGTETYKLWDHVRFIRNPNSNDSSKEEIGQIIEISGFRSNLNASIDLTDEPFKVSSSKYTELETNLRKKQIKLLVRVYERKAWTGTRSNPHHYNDDAQVMDYLDDRRLWYSSHEEIVDGLNGLIGKCEIEHFIESDQSFININPQKAWKSLVDQIQEIRSSLHKFYSVLPTQAQQELRCSVPELVPNLLPFLSFRSSNLLELQEVEDEKIVLKELVKEYDQMKLSHLELFGGIGSFSLGFSEHGLTDQKRTVFIDWSVPACETASINFPKSTIFCADVNEILCLMITGKTRQGKSSVRDLRTGLQIFPDQLPKPGDFDIITAGFPCGSHSTLNVLRKGEDSKNALCGTALSFIEFLKPTYVYFENVRGLLKTQLVDRETQEILTHAFLRLMCGTMITLDYQLRFGVLQAAQYGTPQERRRFILTAVKRGYTLPNLPDPTHFYPDGNLQIKLPDQNKIFMDFRTRYSRGTLDPITIGDTISDLPCFEYRNPMKIMGDFNKPTRKKFKKRSKECVLVNGDHRFGRLEKTDWVGFQKFKYRINPQNNFQIYLRTQRKEDDDLVLQNDGDEEEEPINWHVTGRFSEKTVEQIWHIPIREGADYKDLPEELKYKEAEPKKSQTKDYSRDYEGNFGRLSPHLLFRTVITTMDPRNQGRTGQVLHPSQHRVLTVLEAQRAQGFPDWFVLSNKSEGVKGLYKQIGNSIPLPITRSLAFCLCESREADWNRNGKRIDVEMNGMILMDLMKVWESFQD